MSIQRELAFHEAMVNLYHQTKRETGYDEKRLIRRIAEDGGLATAHRLLQARTLQPGFVKLWTLKRLDLTVERTVLLPQWSPLFSPEELLEAWNRLVAHGWTT